MALALRLTILKSGFYFTQKLSFSRTIEGNAEPLPDGTAKSYFSRSDQKGARGGRRMAVIALQHQTYKTEQTFCVCNIKSGRNRTQQNI
jgi:hypothetical protein